MMKRIAGILIAFLMQLNALFGFSAGVGDAAPVPDALYDPDTVVDVIVELNEQSMLESVSSSEERDAMVDSIDTSDQYQQIQQAHSRLKETIQKKFAEADFTFGYDYSFVTNGISFAIPYRFLSALKKLSGVKDVTVSTSYNAPSTVLPLEPVSAYSDQDAFTGLQQAHERGYTGKGTVIAVVDTGFELGHEAFDFEVQDPTYSKQDIALKSAFGFLNTIVPRFSAHYISSKIPYRWDYAKADKGVHNPNSSHGTHVAGIVGGKSSQLVGAAPDAQLLLMKVFDDKKDAVAKEYVILAALDDCVKLKADVVNLSLGSECGQAPDNIFTGAVVKRLQRAGVNVVASAGNAGSLASFDNISGAAMNIDLFDYGTTNSPGSYDSFFSVASSAISSRTSFSPQTISLPGNGSLMMSSFSAWGPTEDLRLKPEITTPGSDIYSSVPENGYGYMSGTSMAAPYYAGVAAIMEQYALENGLTTGKKQAGEFVNALLMSTATVFKAANASAVYSPRQQGAGFLNLPAALATPACLTQADGTSRPKNELGEINDGLLRLSCRVYNFSDETLQYRVRETVLTDSYRKIGDRYDNTVTSKLLGKENYSVTFEEGVDADGIVTVAPHGSQPVRLTITVDPAFLSAYKSIFINGFFLDGFLAFEDPAGEQPTLSYPFMGFYGDWEKDMLFDYSIYDEHPPYLNGEWGLAVTDGANYYPLGVNIFESGKQTGIDTKYCAYSKNAYDMKKPYVTVSVGLLRNAKRMDFNLFTDSGIFRYCGSTLFEYCRKTVNSNSATHGVLWGGKSGLINGNRYVYKVSTRAQNYNSGRQTIEFPFVVDNDAPTVESCSYSVVDGSKTLTLRIRDDHYVMGYQLLTKEGRIVATESFYGVEPENGVYTSVVNVSEKGRRFTDEQLQTLTLYVIDYAYNETTGEITLDSSSVQPATISRYLLPEPHRYILNRESVAIDNTEEQQTAAPKGPFSDLIEKLKKWN